MFGLNRLRVGIAEDAKAMTGCTVLLFEGGARASADVRGAAPGTREVALLAPDKLMDRIDALLLAGGSAFGLAAATGVVRYLSEHGIGFKTPWMNVPIVPAAVVFDLNIGSADKFPDDEMGYEACVAASKDDFRSGSHGAGTGATVGKWAGTEHAMKSGQGAGVAQLGGLIVIAVTVVNAIGDVVDDRNNVIAGAVKEGRFLASGAALSERRAMSPLPGTNTTLAAVVTNARTSKVDLNRIAQRGHDALARKIVPVHTAYDGDSVFAVGFDEVEADLDLVASLAVEAIEKAVDDAVTSAEPLGALPTHSNLRCR